ncbi:hypothetical protein [uncultured Jatrophihabitans sp.]|uniref:hypothetical protein n=1 Tax=uncultured Jatrophihabitans sp. TaxID=1610747 RepID=UPI0035CA38BF
MSTAHAEAIGMGITAVFFVGITFVALRTQRRTGQPNQWRYVAPLAALVAVTFLVLNLNGVVIRGG